MFFSQLGTEIRFTETFTDLIAGTVADPTTVTLKFRDPNGNETSVTYAGAQIVRDSVGVYHYDFTPPIPSKQGQAWLARWVATGAIVATDEIKFSVLASGFVNP